MAEAFALSISLRPGDMPHLSEKEDDERTASTKDCISVDESAASGGCSVCSFFSTDTSDTLSIGHAFHIIASEFMFAFTGKSKSSSSEHFGQIQYVNTHVSEDASEHSSIASATSSPHEKNEHAPGLKARLFVPPALRGLATNSPPDTTEGGVKNRTNVKINAASRKHGDQKQSIFGHGTCYSERYKLIAGEGKRNHDRTRKSHLSLTQARRQCNAIGQEQQPIELDILWKLIWGGSDFYRFACGNERH